MRAPVRPNIVWIVSEDHGPHLGCFGDSYATTPHVDALAARGIVYTRAWSCAPVCAPARTALISGMYPTATGSEHMRSMLAYPAGRQMFPSLLRAAGYYCTNNAKEDYNLARPADVWDESSPTAHWKHRPAGQPFFAVFNSGKSHEGQIRARPHALVHDPSAARVPAYHPDTPEVRRDWAQYYDGVSAADADAGRRLAEIEAAGLADDTIVFYFADHGSGMPRNKRWPLDAGLHVPLVVYLPPRLRNLRPADETDPHRCSRLVSFVDFAPTVLSLAGLVPPDWMQGEAFLGSRARPPRSAMFGFRGRMDERYDLVRSATDGRYVYVRNYMPHRIYGQHLAYMFETPTTQVWRRMHEQGRLNRAQEAFWRTKPPEELYLLETDPDEVLNLADAPEHRPALLRLRETLRRWIVDTRDAGFLPEGELHRRFGPTNPADSAGNDELYPLERILATAELASDARLGRLERLVERLGDVDSGVRYWAALGILIRGAPAAAQCERALEQALGDSSPSVQIAAAEALALYAPDPPCREAAALLAALADWSRHDVFTVMAALNALQSLADHNRLLPLPLTGLPRQGPVPHPRYASYVPRLLDHLLEPRP